MVCVARAEAAENGDEIGRAERLVRNSRLNAWFERICNPLNDTHGYCVVRSNAASP